MVLHGLILKRVVKFIMPILKIISQDDSNGMRGKKRLGPLGEGYLGEWALAV